MSTFLVYNPIIYIPAEAGGQIKRKYRHSPHLNRPAKPYSQLDPLSFPRRIFRHHIPNPFYVGIDRKLILSPLQFQKYDRPQNAFEIPFAINGLWPLNNLALKKDHGHPERKREERPFRHTRPERVDAILQFVKFLLWVRLIQGFRRSSKSHGMD